MQIDIYGNLPLVKIKPTLLPEWIGSDNSTIKIDSEKLPTIFQIRKDCIIGYPDYSMLPKNRDSKTIKHSGKYTQSARKKFKRYLELWNYTITDTAINFSFITLTLSSKMSEKINYTNYLKQLLEKLETRYNKFNYAWKIEYQKNGNLHFHLITDKEMDWKIVRSQWNKIQSNHVDEYQIKQKMKYKNGYYFDAEMLDYKGDVVEDQIQFNRYKKGTKANWRNPNSTDVKIVNDNNGIGAYIGKYISKANDENEEQIHTHKIKRFYGCSDSLRELKYTTINECELDLEIISVLIDCKLKDIRDENYRYKCSISEKIYSDQIINRESETLQKNRDILSNHTAVINQKLIDKEVKKYDNIFA